MSEWIKWHGGACPVMQGVTIDVKRYNGDKEFDLECLQSLDNTEQMFWDYDTDDYDPYDIVAYRLSGLAASEPLRKHTHYFRDVEHLKIIDIYRLLEVYEVFCPIAQHIIKKAVAAGRRGHKDLERDWRDIIDSAERRIDMLKEDASK